MRRPGVLLRSPGSPWRAFWTSFVAIAVAAGIPLTIKTLVLGSWAQWLGFLPYLLAIVVGGAALWGAICAIPVVIQGWAWRKIAEDTPVAEHDEGLGS
jgi:uncharacterized protein YqcC (DUF446 family)